MKEKIQKADGVKRILCILLSVGIFAFVLYNIFCYDKESEMYYPLSRYYVPQWGRFLNADAYFTTGFQTYATNMFAYCANNPVNSSDLYGYRDKDDHKSWTKSTALQLDFWGSIPEKNRGWKQKC